jgi:hypothetical protein
LGQTEHHHQASIGAVATTYLGTIGTTSGRVHVRDAAREGVATGRTFGGANRNDHRGGQRGLASFRRVGAAAARWASGNFQWDHLQVLIRTTANKQKVAAEIITRERETARRTNQHHRDIHNDDDASRLSGDVYISTNNDIFTLLNKNGRLRNE